MQTVVVLTGSGISAESGISTFRDKGGLWEQYNIEDVATPEAFERNPELVLEFYNQRRKQLFEVEPNAAHYALARLEQAYDVQIITQNVDDLHERAGSSNVLHLHGEIKKAQSTADPSLVYELDDWQLNPGDKCEKGSQLRPHVVWFGEPVPKMQDAVMITSRADICVVIGTSMNVYPAAGLIHYVPDDKPKYLVDPSAQAPHGIKNLKTYSEKAGKAVPEIVDTLLKEKS